MLSEDDAEAKPKSSLPADLQSAQNRRAYPDADELAVQGEDPQRGALGSMQEGPHEDGNQHDDPDSECFPDLLLLLSQPEHASQSSLPAPPSQLPSSTKEETLASAAAAFLKKHSSSSLQKTIPPKVNAYDMETLRAKSQKKLSFNFLLATITQELETAQRLPLGSHQQILALGEVTPKVFLALDNITYACTRLTDSKYDDFGVRFEKYHALLFLAQRKMQFNDDPGLEQEQAFFLKYRAALKIASPSFTKTINGSDNFQQAMNATLLTEQRKRKRDALQLSEASPASCSSLSSSRTPDLLSEKEAAQHDYLELLQSILDELSTTKDFIVSKEATPEK